MKTLQPRLFPDRKVRASLFRGLTSEECKTIIFKDVPSDKRSSKGNKSFQEVSLEGFATLIIWQRVILKDESPWIVALFSEVLKLGRNQENGQGEDTYTILTEAPLNPQAMDTLKQIIFQGLSKLQPETFQPSLF